MIRFLLAFIIFLSLAINSFSHDEKKTPIRKEKNIKYPQKDEKIKYLCTMANVNALKMEPFFGKYRIRIFFDGSLIYKIHVREADFEKSKKILKMYLKTNPKVMYW